MSEAVYGPIITAAFAIFFGWMLRQGFKTGSMEFGFYGTSWTGRRQDQPIRFWAIAILHMLMTFLCALGTVVQIFFSGGIDR